MASLTSDVLNTSSETDNIPPIQTKNSIDISLKGSSSPQETTEQLKLTVSGKAIQEDSRYSKKREVFRFLSDWLVSCVAWSNEPGESFRLALASYVEEYSNRIQLVSLSKDEYNEEIYALTSFEHPYPATKLLWIPRNNNQLQLPQMLATTADYLRLWRVNELPPTESHINHSDQSALFEDESSIRDKVEVKLECLLNTNKGMKYCAPLTSFDWNECDPSIIVTSSVDTTCAVWDIAVSKVLDTVVSDPFIGSDRVTCNLRSQIVAHNHEVYDVSFSRSGTGREVFVSAGGDGSVRLFDLRRLSTSTMLYESERTSINDRKALVRVNCNKQDPNYVSAFGSNSKDIIIIDLRQPGRPIVVLDNHTANLNSMSWAPHSAHHICSASDDNQALIWDLSKLPNDIKEPLLAYRANGKINTISWSASHSDWIAIGFENYLELLRV